jgi:hypothetical protein
VSNYQNGDFDTKYGTITVRNPGRVQAPPNLQTLQRRAGKDGTDGLVYSKDAGDVVLQGPALRAFRAAEVRSTPARLRKKGKVQPIILTGVGYRSYATQKALYEGPDNTNGTRFADPDGSLHVEGLAVDNHTGFFRLLRRTRVRKALIAEGCFFGVPGEDWHASFRLSG